MCLKQVSAVLHVPSVIFLQMFCPLSQAVSRGHWYGSCYRYFGFIGHFDLIRFLFEDVAKQGAGVIIALVCVPYLS